MSGRFVSGGTIASTGEVSNDAPKDTQEKPDRTVKNKEWEIVQQELEAERKRREESRAKAAEGGEKSLYDVLQENKGLYPEQAPSCPVHTEDSFEDVTWLTDLIQRLSKQPLRSRQSCGTNSGP
jgi:hypothetical protein